jgi:hypothetical protein
MWVNNIKIDIRLIVWVVVEWIGLAQEKDQWRALVNSVMDFLVPYNFGKFFSRCTTGGF